MDILSTSENSLKEHPMYTKTIAAIFAALTLFLSGCNTIKGIGQDVQKAGTAIENATKK